MEKEFFCGHQAVIVVVLPVGCDLKPGQKVRWWIESRDGVVCEPDHGSAPAITSHGRLVIEICFRPTTVGNFEIKLRAGQNRARVQVDYRVLQNPSMLTSLALASLATSGSLPLSRSPSTMVDDPADAYARQSVEPVNAIHDIEPTSSSKFSRSSLGWFALFAVAVFGGVLAYFLFSGRL